MAVRGRGVSLTEPCPECRGSLERIERAFRWQKDVKDGAQCRECRTLWPIKGEEIEPLRLARRGRE